MGKIWRIAKTVLGLRMCSWSAAPVVDDAEEDLEDDYDSRAAKSCPATPARFPAPKTPQSFRVSKGSCAICLEVIKSGAGQAVFTAECSHTFHFSCIASNVKHGNTVCPVCRANWKEVPWVAPTTPSALSPNRRPPPRSAYASPLRTFSPTYQDATVRFEEDQQPDPVIRIIDESIANARSPTRNQPSEPLVYDDDESLGSELNSGESSAQRTSSAEFADAEQVFCVTPARDGSAAENSFKLQLETYPEFGSVSFSEQRTSFNVLVHVKAPDGTSSRPATCEGILDPTQRAPIDLVTVLDVSGSMAGTKLVLLKRAMSFVIRNLSSRDRLSVVVFSSTAKRIFPLKTMVEEGRQFALRAIETQGCTGGTNITEGLRKGAKVLEERKFKNPVASIMLLSDGQDTYCMGTRGQIFPSENFVRQGNRLINGNGQSPRIPVHTFGFGADHDAATMHLISQVSGGTFSFIQAEAGVQEAFAQCVGGLLSVVVQDVQLVISSPFGNNSRIKNVHAGSYRSSVSDDLSQATVKLGDLYAYEERDILVELELPPLQTRQDDCFILEAGCSYTDPVLQHQICTSSRKLSVSRPDFVRANYQKVSVEVDRHKNRLLAARAITEAGSLAEAGDIEGAQRTIRASQLAIQNSLAAQAGDKLSKALEGELGEILTQVGNRIMYERYGRAYILSAQSSHLTQRATTRGYYNSTEDYQTPSMTGMILRSQQSPKHTSNT